MQPFLKLAGLAQLPASSCQPSGAGPSLGYNETMRIVNYKQTTNKARQVGEQAEY